MPSVDVINGSLHKAVPSAHYEEHVAPKLKKLRKDIDYDNAVFDPKKHIVFTEEMYDSIRVHSLQDLGLDPPDKVGDFALADPFPMFSDEAIEIMRYEILRD